MKVEDAVLLANRTAAAIVGTSGPVMDLEEFQKISEEWENELNKRIFYRLELERKSMACICTDCTDSSLGNSERKSVYAGHDVDK